MNEEVVMNRKPNILFIFSDQQRWDTMGCYGQKLNVTPHLDQLAREGVRFDQAFTCQPVCGPARSCLQTGLYPTETGCYRNDIALDVNERTIAHHLSESGYQVGYVGKWHLASHTEKGIDYRTTAIPPERRGGYKDYWMATDLLEFTSHGYDGYVFDGDMKQVDFKGYRADCVTDFAIDYIQKWEQDQSYFLVLSYIEPHHQTITTGMRVRMAHKSCSRTSTRQATWWDRMVTGRKTIPIISDAATVLMKTWDV